MNERRSINFMWVLVFFASLVIYTVSLFLGDLNQDEGWYLYAARMVSRGQFPFLDFASTQGPVMPIVYVLAQPFVNLWGLAGGRLFTAMLGLLTALSAAWLASMLTEGTDTSKTQVTKSRVAALIAFILVGTNLYQVYYTTMIKTYALTGLLIVIGFILLIRALRVGGLVPLFFSGLLFAFASATRSSAFVLLPILFGGLVVGRVWGNRQKRISWLQISFFVFGGLSGGCIAFLPFLLKAPQATWFGLVEYHSQRQAAEGIIQSLAYKGGFVLRLIGFYFVPIALAMAAVLKKQGMSAVVCEGGSREQGAGRDEPVGLRPPLSFLWGGVIGVTLLHILAPFPYDDYQVIIYPIFAAALSVVLARLVAGAIWPTNSILTPRLGLIALVFVLSIAHSLSSPLLQGWLLAKRDRIWWPMKSETSLKKLQRVGSMIDEMTETGDLILTQDTYLAVEADLDVPKGLELGPFSYYPEMSDDKADACHVLNRDKMRRLLMGSEASVAAFSEYGLVIKSPEIIELPIDEQAELWRMIEMNYSLVEEIPEFGQAGTQLRILKKR